MYRSRSITYRNVMYLPIIAQRRLVGAKLYWDKAMILDGNSNLKENHK